MVKATAIDPSRLDADGVYRKEGPARVFVSETSAIAAIKEGRIRPGDVLVLTGIGPMGTGMEETYQVTGALKHLPFGNEVALLTDARFSGVSTGACIGHIGPEGLAGGPIGKVRDGDLIRIHIGRDEGSVDLVGEGERRFTAEEGAAVLASRTTRGDLAAARPAARGHAPLGRAAARRRRDVERMRVRRGPDRRGPRGGPGGAGEARGLSPGQRAGDAARPTRGRARRSRPRPRSTATAATRPSRAVAPDTTSAAATARVGTAGQAWSGTRPRSRRPARTRSARALVPNCISTAMLDRAKSSPSSPRLTIVATTTQVTATARIGTPFGDVLSRSNSVRLARGKGGQVAGRRDHHPEGDAEGRDAGPHGDEPREACSRRPPRPFPRAEPPRTRARAAP